MQGKTRWSTLLRSFPKSIVVHALARACIAGEPSTHELTARMHATLGHEWRWVRPLARRYADEFAGGIRPTLKETELFLKQDERFQDAWRRYWAKLRIAEWVTEPQVMQPVAAAREWLVPAIACEGELADWLGVSTAELEWFADVKAFSAKSSDEKVKHYVCHAIVKSAGGVRVVEAPKRRLKTIQRRILKEILERIPTHPAVHGFVPGRSIATFAAPHVGRQVVLRMDLKEFFPSIRAARLQAMFRTAGYPDTVASLLTGLCTNFVPVRFWRGLRHDISFEERMWARDLYSRPHLPQGAPTSPALANICAFRLDCRLSGLVSAVGATYTRYADDLVFSGDRAFGGRARGFAEHVAAIAQEEGFAVNHRKTRVMPQSARQYVAGVVVNARVNVVRKDFDELKAILTNCLHKGVAAQNRVNHPAFEEHLRGRVAFVEMIHAAKGARLRRIFDQIQWPQA